MRIKDRGIGVGGRWQHVVGTETWKTGLVSPIKADLTPN